MRTHHALRTRTLRSRAAKTTVATATLLLLTPCFGQLKDICVPAIGDVLGNPPVIDGVPSDPGWNRSGQVGLDQTTLNPGQPAVDSMTRSGVFQYGINGNALYLTYDFDASLFSADPALTTMILVLSPDGNPAHDWRLHFTNFSDTTTVPTLAIWRDSTGSATGGGWNQSTTVDSSGNRAPCAAGDTGFRSNCAFFAALDATGKPPTNQTCTQPAAPRGSQFRSTVDPVTHRFTLEAMIPLNTGVESAGFDYCGFSLPGGTQTFGVYANVINGVQDQSMFVESPFPANSPLVFTGGTPTLQNPPDIERSTPAPANWAAGSQGTRSACTGVDVQSAGVSQLSGSGFGNTTIAVPPEASGFYENASGTHLTTADACTQPPPAGLADNYRWSGTQTAPTGTFSVDNYYRARLANSGAPVAAGKVFTQFSIAPWGLPGSSEWDLIGKRFDPDAPGGNDIDATAPNSIAIPTGGSVDEQTDWRLSYKESCAYSLSGLVSGGMTFTGHHCVQAEARTADPLLNFVHKSLQFNNNVQHASKATSTAHVGTLGYGPHPADLPSHKLLLSVDQRATQVAGKEGALRAVATKSGPGPGFATLPPIAAGSLPGDVSQELDVIARGYLATDDKLFINNKIYRRARFVGAFTMQVGHDGQINGWNVDMSPVSCPGGGHDCVKKTATGYELSIPDNGAIDLNTVVEAIEPGGGGSASSPWAAWLALGATIPHGSFSNDHDSGFVGTLGLEYAINPQLSVEATLAAHHFDGKGSAADIDVTAFGVDAKYYVTPAPLRWFVDGGIGVYAFDPGSTRFGGTIGGGVQVALGHGWAIEGRYNLQSVTSNAPDTTWSTLQIAVRKAF